MFSLTDLKVCAHAGETGALGSSWGLNQVLPRALALRSIPLLFLGQISAVEGCKGEPDRASAFRGCRPEEKRKLEVLTGLLGKGGVQRWEEDFLPGP
jgi:hypothetical protein